jgi:5-bromo-4-chloroindolyl phosphate hydrolysis protein
MSEKESEIKQKFSQIRTLLEKLEREIHAARQILKGDLRD